MQYSYVGVVGNSSVVLDTNVQCCVTVDIQSDLNGVWTKKLKTTICDTMDIQPELHGY